MSFKKLVIKIGSNVITQDDGLPDISRFQKIVAQVAELSKRRIKTVLVSSGAVASGRSLLTIRKNLDPVAARQQLAAVGQIKLINTYSELFRKHGLLCAQVLVTKGDFRDRMHYLNMKRCIANLLENNIIPIVNENDVIAVTELMFTDNDELSGLIASMTGADALILLTSVDGLYDGNPSHPGSKLISTVDGSKKDFSFITPEKSNFGRGGMLTKARMAMKLAQVGITVHIANGTEDDIILKIIDGKQAGTKFIPQKHASHLKRWVAHSEGYAKGKVYVNDGAKEALTKAGKAVSLLPVGILKIEGDFEKGDIIKILGSKNELIGMGVARYSSEKARERTGQKNQQPLIHYDYLYLHPE
ncbi:MAG TPA: glutamate 5-kinase [Chitinophagales bacterium]|nr:glutamate 5-kinase [Chitinophagales bacterium]